MGNIDEKHAETKKKAKTTATTSSLAEENKEKPSPSLLSFQLLEGYGERMHFNHGERLNVQRVNTTSSSSGSQVFSTNDIMKMARTKLLYCTSQNLDVVTILINGSLDANSGMSSENCEDLELALLLHASALRVYNRQFDRAKTLLALSGQSSSDSGNPLQKVVFYFAEALENRITRESGDPSENQEENQRNRKAVEEALTVFKPAIVQCEQDLPFCRVTEYTAIQSILENVASAKRVHLVDLGIRSGSHWTVMMQGLHGLADRSECPLEMLKLTAIGISKEIIEKIGKHSSSFAETMKIPFQFKLLVSNLQDLKEDMFETEADEALAVHSMLRLASLLPWPDRLESVVQTIANLHPRVMVTTELEANTNTSNFIDWFNETVSIASAVFDCLEDCMDRENPCRATIEKVFIREGIQNIITAEGEERVHRQQRIDLWRTIVVRCGLVELPLSDFALIQANMLLKNNPRWRSCSLDSDGKGLMVGRRGTPIKSISVWKSESC